MLLEICEEIDAYSARDAHRIRLFLIRHGESMANLQGTLAGQSDSPLTDRGRLEAHALSNTHWIKDHSSFWRIYSSDLSRANDTAKLALHDKYQDDKMDELIIRDKRLRERAFGAHEGMPRKMSLEEAIKIRKEMNMDNELLNPYESEQDITNRCISWINELVIEATDEIQINNEDPLHVLVFSHAGWIRGMLLHYIGKVAFEKHPRSQYAECYHKPKFLIPNTSVTVLDVWIRDKNVHQGDDLSLQVELVELNCVDHLATVDGKQTLSID